MDATKAFQEHIAPELDPSLLARVALVQQPIHFSDGPFSHWLVKVMADHRVLWKMDFGPDGNLLRWSVRGRTPEELKSLPIDMLEMQPEEVVKTARSLLQETVPDSAGFRLVAHKSATRLAWMLDCPGYRIFVTPNYAWKEPH